MFRMLTFADELVSCAIKSRHLPFLLLNSFTIAPYLGYDQVALVEQRLVLLRWVILREGRDNILARLVSECKMNR